jgi:hypothetical protein
MSSKLMDLQRFGRVGAVILKVVRILLYVACAVILGGLVLTMAFGDGLMSAPFINGFEMQVRLSGATVFSTSASDFASQACAVLVSLLVSAILQLLVLIFAGRVFRELARGVTPFSPENVWSFKAIAVAVALMSIVPGIVVLITQIVLGMPGMSFGFDGMYLVIALVVYCLALVFDYGTDLQTLQDETL